MRLRLDAVSWREIDDEIVALDQRDATYFSISGTGAMLWRLLAQVTTRQHLVDALVDRYAVEEARASADLATFLAQLEARELLES